MIIFPMFPSCYGARNYIFIEWFCCINKICVPSQIFCNDEVTVRKAENLFKLSFHTECIIYNLNIMERWHNKHKQLFQTTFSNNNLG